MSTAAGLVPVERAGSTVSGIYTVQEGGRYLAERSLVYGRLVVEAFCWYLYWRIVEL